MGPLNPLGEPTEDDSCGWEEAAIDRAEPSGWWWRLSVPSLGGSSRWEVRLDALLLHGEKPRMELDIVDADAGSCPRADEPLV